MLYNKLILNWQIEKLKTLLSDSSNVNFNFVNFTPLPLPLDPNIKIQGIDVNNATLFKVSHLKTAVEVNFKLLRFWIPFFHISFFDFTIEIS